MEKMENIDVETCLDFYFTVLIWLKREKPSRCEAGGALWEFSSVTTN